MSAHNKTLGKTLVDDQKGRMKRQEKQRYYEQRRRQELNDSLDSVRDLMEAKFRVASKKMSSKRSIVDMALAILKRFPDQLLPLENLEPVLLSSPPPPPLPEIVVQSICVVCVCQDATVRTLLCSGCFLNG